MVTSFEEDNIAVVKELLDGVSDADVRALCVQALRTWRGKHQDAGQFSLHGDLGLEVVPLLLAHKDLAPASPDSLNGLKEPFITQQTQPWFIGVADFISWFMRSGFGDSIAVMAQNVVSIRLTRQGMQLLDSETTIASNNIPPSNRYELAECLGEGVEGEVWRARDIALQRNVAIKFVRIANATKQHVLQQARALARVPAPNIITVYDVTKIVDPSTQTIVDAIIMELAEGVSFGECLVPGLRPTDALRIGNGILEAVAAYHSRDLAHLDLHDGNVIVGDLHVKIIDPMYLATTGMQSLRTRERAQQRDVRNMCGLLVDLLNTVQVQSDAVARLARSSTGVTVEIKADPVLSTHG